MKKALFPCQKCVKEIGAEKMDVNQAASMSERKLRLQIVNTYNNQ